MTIHTINRTMYTGTDQDNGEPQFILKTEKEGEITILLPLHKDLEADVASPEKFNNLLVYGGSVGNALQWVPFDQFAYQLEGANVLWQDQVTVDVVEG